MSRKESSCRKSHHTEDLASRPEIQIPVSYVYHLLREEQYTPFICSSMTHFFLTMLDRLTDYILELAGSEARTPQTTPQRGKKEDHNCEPPRVFNNVSFSLFDEMPGPRRNG
ncbi:huntingtin-interacting protein M [Marmota monax]|uniref:Huntingtin-interacting protein M n=1 Tax=Marmota monax TaxID=9995 RepID=A0A5E4CY28_MARMO|nr:huntingtin-interacting protein M [Marmota monax]KAF7469905.1 hypothetical protein GHT09_018652 [Marmota monax]VTJ86696.1 Hypothetical predicted protein [Marmota monax]